jgi:signal transduction histidine kinase
MRLTRLPIATRLGTAAAVVCAAVVVVALGVLQYRWNRAASDATGVRLADALQISIVNWHLDLFRNLSELSLTLRPPANARVDAAALVPQLAEWRSIARYPDLVAGVFLVGPDRVEAIASATPAAEWTARLAPLAALLRSAPPAAAVIPDQPLAESFYNIGSALREWRFNPGLPALVHAVPEGGTWLVVRLDDRVLRERILPDLAHRYFQGLNGLDYDVAVVTPEPSRRVLYTSAPGFGDDDAPDADARMDVFATSGRALQIFHRAAENDGPTAAVGVSWFPLLRTSQTDRAWQLIVRHRRGGSLGQFVLTMRRRGLAVSAGALALLVLSMSMLIVTGIRAHRLGRLQMDFVTAVSHELRTPLTIIGAAADNLNDGVIESPAQLQEYSGIIGREVETLGGLVERILLFVATRDGRHHYVLEPIDANEVIDAVLASTDTLARAAGVVIERAGTGPLPVIADRAALTHCLENLVTNALKYGAAGGVIRISGSTTPAGRVAISVADAGAGIAPEDLPHIFEPFYRGQAARAAQIHGTGIGLALAQQMAVAMGGALAAVSSDTGATFTLTLQRRSVT